MTENPYQQYQKVKMDSTSKQDLIIMVYDGAVSFIDRSVQHIQEKDFEKVHFTSLRAQALINELMLSLNMDKGGEIARNLFNLYDYLIYRLVIGNAKKEKEPFLEVKELLLELRAAWVEAKKKVG